MVKIDDKMNLIVIDSNKCQNKINMKFINYLFIGFILFISNSCVFAQTKSELDTVTGYAVVYSNFNRSTICESSSWIFYERLLDVKFRCFEENLNDSNSVVILNTFEVSNLNFWNHKSYLFDPNNVNTRVKVIKCTIAVKKFDGDTSGIYNVEKTKYSKTYFTFYKLNRVLSQQEIPLEEMRKFNFLDGKIFSNKKRKYKYGDMKKEKKACNLYWLNTKYDKM